MISASSESVHNSPESVRNTSVSDQPSGDDSLGFSPLCHGDRRVFVE